MDDCFKRQTSTVTPAEPGGFPWGLIAALLGGELLVMREAGEITLDLANGSHAPRLHLGRDARIFLCPAG